MAKKRASVQKRKRERLKAEKAAIKAARKAHRADDGDELDNTEGGDGDIISMRDALAARGLLPEDDAE